MESPGPLLSGPPHLDLLQHRVEDQELHLVLLRRAQAREGEGDPDRRRLDDGPDHASPRVQHLRLRQAKLDPHVLVGRRGFGEKRGEAAHGDVLRHRPDLGDAPLEVGLQGPGDAKRLARRLPRLECGHLGAQQGSSQLVPPGTVGVQAVAGERPGPGLLVLRLELDEPGLEAHADPPGKYRMLSKVRRDAITRRAGASRESGEPRKASPARGRGGTILAAAATSSWLPWARTPFET